MYFVLRYSNSIITRGTICVREPPAEEEYGAVLVAALLSPIPLAHPRILAVHAGTSLLLLYYCTVVLFPHPRTRPTTKRDPNSGCERTTYGTIVPHNLTVEHQKQWRTRHGELARA